MEDQKISRLHTAANDNRKDFYVYAWLRPSGEPFYIGKGTGRRASVPKAHNPIFVQIVEKIKKSGGEPTIVLLHERLAEDDAFRLEREEILRYGRKDIGTGILANFTNGGEGLSGRTPSADTREKIATSLRGQKYPRERAEKTARGLRGRRQTLEHRENNAASQRGKKMSAEAIAKTAAFNTGRKHTPEARKNMSASHMGKTLSPEAREKLSLAHKGRPKTPEHAAKISAAKRLSPPKSGHKGVTFRKREQKWVARIWNGEGSLYLGSFPAPEDAAHAYDAAAIAAWGLGNCYLNFPEECAH